MHRSQTLADIGDGEYSNEKRLVNVRVDGTDDLPSLITESYTWQVPDYRVYQDLAQIKTDS
jgi:hypothetical protein